MFNRDGESIRKTERAVRYAVKQVKVTP